MREFARRTVPRLLLRVLVLLVIVVVLALAWRAWDGRRSPALMPWHTMVPDELDDATIDGADWARYIEHEDRLRAKVRADVMRSPPEGAPMPADRFVRGSAVDPAGFANDWNRSYIIKPAGKPVGAVVLLHGLTDSPYSLRHVARHYADAGFVAVGIRLPGHGTVPAGLTRVDWEDWAAATRLAVREAVRLAGPDVPLHIVGFSNGGALAMMYALDALEKPGIPQPARLVLISPMIGVTRLARIAGLAELPAFLPAFERSAWLDVAPEFNPFKYNSFPVNGARQSYRLTRALQRRIVAAADNGSMAKLPPVLTFQSVIDFTVSTPAILSALYAYLPDNGSELVLFDVNRAAKFGPLMRTAANRALERLMPPLPVPYRLTVITSPQVGAAIRTPIPGTPHTPMPPETTPGSIERTIPAGSTQATLRPLDQPYPADVFSLSHVAIPFPIDDSLYGMEPPPGPPDYGLNLGTLTARGERGTLNINADALMRIASNPFHPYLMSRIDEGIAAASTRPAAVLDGDTRSRAEANARKTRTPDPELPEALDTEAAHAYAP